MVIINSTNNKGEPIRYVMDGYLIKALDAAKHRVLKKKWDYVSIICGLPGSGKSTFARSCAKYCCEWFDETYIAFTAQEFIEISNRAPENSSIILDESFASLNTQVSKSPDFLRIINHLQLLRQRHLFIFLCLPNFFDLVKGIAIFRCSHLFLTYAEDDGTRGNFLAFGRHAKRVLYIKGHRFLDYYCVKANFRGKFFKNKAICNEIEYDTRKLKHLTDQDKKIKETYGRVDDIREIAWKLRNNLKLKYVQIGEILKKDPESCKSLVFQHEKYAKEMNKIENELEAQNKTP